MNSIEILKKKEFAAIITIMVFDNKIQFYQYLFYTAFSFQAK